MTTTTTISSPIVILAFCLHLPTTATRSLPSRRDVSLPPSRHLPPLTATPRRPRKPNHYWDDIKNLLTELRLFIRHHPNHPSEKMPTVTQLRLAHRHDLIKAIHTHGGFSKVGSFIGLTTIRRSRYLTTSPSYRTQTLQEVHSSIIALCQSGQIQQNKMPTSSTLRRLGEIQLLNRIVFLGGFSQVATFLKFQQNQAALTVDKNARKKREYWHSWRVVEIELHNFAKQYCNGHMPLQRQLISMKRSDLLNAIRNHGGLSHVSRKAGLQPSPANPSKRPRGYWNDVTVVHAELTTYTARHGHAGLMPRKEQLIRYGRSDLVYAVEKHGGFSAVAASMHLVWHGPTSFWRVFRNLQIRLMSFVHKQNLGVRMPNVEYLFNCRRMDLVYGIMIHGGIMKVANRTGLKVVYEHSWKRESWWICGGDRNNIVKELERILKIQPLERKRNMPSSVLLVQLGRCELATAVRDHGGWVYYAQKLGLRFAFDVRQQGFWQRESNVVHELLNYVKERYGNWEFPGLIIENDTKLPGKQHVPSSEMLKRDGRSDIAFAIETFHGGMLKLAGKQGWEVAKDVMECKPAEHLSEWTKYEASLQGWIEIHGSIGTMPTKQQLVTTGRHDLRYATLRHGGFDIVSQRLQLCCIINSSNYVYMHQWLGLHAAKFGMLLNLEQEKDEDKMGNYKRKLKRKLYRTLEGNGIGWSRYLLTSSASYLDDDGRIVKKKRHGKLIRDCLHHHIVDSDVDLTARNKKSSQQNNVILLSENELDLLRRKYRHLPPDDLIST